MRVLPILIVLVTTVLFSCDKEESSSGSNDLNGTWRHYDRAQDYNEDWRVKKWIIEHHGGSYFTNRYIVFSQDEYCSYDKEDGGTKGEEKCLEFDLKGDEITFEDGAKVYYSFKADTLILFVPQIDVKEFKLNSREYAYIKQ